MAHQVADLDNLQIQFVYEGNRKKAVLHVFNADMTEIVETWPLPLVIAGVLAEHGLASGS